MLLLGPEGKACGTIYCERDDEEESIFISAVSVDKAYSIYDLNLA